MMNEVPLFTSLAVKVLALAWKYSLSVIVKVSGSLNPSPLRLKV